jgi:hypothetical protein
MFDRDRLETELTRLAEESRQVCTAFGVRVRLFAEEWLVRLKSDDKDSSSSIDVDSLRRLMAEYPEPAPSRPLDMRGPAFSSGTGKLDTNI